MTADLRLSINSVGQFTGNGLRSSTFAAPDRMDLKDGRFTLVARGWVIASAEIRSARASLDWSGTFDPVP